MAIGIISWIVVELIVGILGKLIMPGRPRRLPANDSNRDDRGSGWRFYCAATRRHRTYGVQHLVDLAGHPRSDHTAGDLPAVRGFAMDLNPM
jgi:hypothetical protein